MSRKAAFPIPTATEKQPKPKNQTGSQSKRGTGKIQRTPSPQKQKKIVLKIDLKKWKSRIFYLPCGDSVKSLLLKQKTILNYTSL
jgi:hypothetical protein